MNFKNLNLFFFMTFALSLSVSATMAADGQPAMPIKTVSSPDNVVVGAEAVGEIDSSSSFYFPALSTFLDFKKIAIQLVEQNGFVVTDEYDDIIIPMLQQAGINPSSVVVVKGVLKHLNTPAAALGSFLLLIDPEQVSKIHSHDLEKSYILKGLMGHEIMHLKNNDGRLLLIIDCAWFLPLSLHLSSAFNVVFNGGLSTHQRLQKSIHNLVLLCIAGYLKKYLETRITRHQEKRADIQAAETYEGVASGLIELFKTVQAHNLEIFNKSIQKINGSNAWGFMKKFRTWRLNRIINMHGDDLYDVRHPLLSERIAYLTPIAEQQERMEQARQKECTVIP